MLKQASFPVVNQSVGTINVHFLTFVFILKYVKQRMEKKAIQKERDSRKRKVTLKIESSGDSARLRGFESEYDVKYILYYFSLAFLRGFNL